MKNKKSTQLLPWATPLLMGLILLSTGCAKLATILNSETDVSAPTQLSLKPGDKQIIVSWKNNNTENIDMVYIRFSDSNPITNTSSDTLIASGNTLSSYTHTALSNGTRYYYGVFAQGHDGQFSDLLRGSGIPTDNTAPGTVSNVSATATPEQVQLQWTNPVSDDFNRTMVRFSTNNVITTPTDGDVIYDESGLTPNTESSYIHSELLTNQLYYYGIFSFDINNNISSVMTASATPLELQWISIVESVSIRTGNKTLRINWTNPDEPTFDRVVIRGSNTNNVSNSDDGDAIYDESNLTPGE